MKKQGTEFLVAALQNGTAIDHIPANVVFKVVSLLQLDQMQQPITIGNNLESKKSGVKGIIKIADRYFENQEINKIAVIAPNCVLNVIKNYEVVDKIRPVLPDVIKGIVKCNNPKCITNNEPMKTKFQVVDKKAIELTCCYCNLKIQKEDIELK